MPAIKGDMYINTHCNYSQPTLIKLDNENIGGHLTPLHYLESRHVDDFDGLFELLICDRIKSSLSEACLRHVLSVENATERGWLDVDGLSDVIDKYSACHNNNNRPQAFAIGQNVTRAGAGQCKPGPPQKFGLNAAPLQSQIIGADLRL